MGSDIVEKRTDSQMDAMRKVDAAILEALETLNDEKEGERELPCPLCGGSLRVAKYDIPWSMVQPVVRFGCEHGCVSGGS